MMKPYDFETPVDRRGSGCVKWDAPLPFGITLTPEQQERLIPLWVADMDFPAAPFIREALRKRLEHGVFGYTIVQDSYYEAVIRWIRERYGLNLHRKWFLHSSAVVPELTAVVKTFCAPDEGVIIQSPAYNCFFSSVLKNGCRVADVPLLRRDLSDGRFTYEMDFDGLEAACADPRNRLLLLCNPHNPVGRRWTEAELRRIGDIALRHGIPVVADEIHCEIVRPGTKYIPFASLSEAFCRESVTLCSPSKSFNTAGLHMANIVVERPDWRERIRKTIEVNEIGEINPFGPVAVEAAYSPEGARWLDGLNQTVWQNYDLLVQRLGEALPALPVCELEATYLAWVDISTLGLSSEEIEAELIRGEQVWVNNGKMYGDDRYLRINLACQPVLMREALDRLVSGLQRLTERGKR